MNQNRRRKKRPSYGVRTIEISRGRHGFGFTISGQSPCILSCIVNGSPAEEAGLRTGDYLIAVNGRNVSKALHDDVVRMIGCCSGLLKIQIAENYYSNSSDEDSTPTAKPRPKYPHRFKQKQQIPVSVAVPFRELCPTPSRSLQQHKVTRVTDNHDYKNIGDVPIATYRSEEPPKIRFGHYHHHPCKYSEVTSTPCPSVGEKRLDKIDRKHNAAVAKKGVGAVETSTSWDGSLEKENHRPLFSEKEINSIVYPSLQQLQCGSEFEDPLFKAVVGYLGTIEMPKEPHVAGRRLSAIRNCIRRLRVEKKVHTLVFLKVFSHCVTLTNAHGVNLAEYPTATIAFCGAYADDKRFFGLVTTRAESVDDAATCSNSCHVFMVDPKLVRHEEHVKRARSFRIECTPDLGAATTECCEFPDSVDPILVSIVGLYRGRGGVPMDLDANVSPQPSNTSSNSDSGIGFRDEGQNSDRVSMVDVDVADYGCLVAAPNVSGDLCWSGRPQIGFRSTVLRAKRDQQSSGKLTVRAMPDPVGFSQGETSFNTERLDAQQDPSIVRKSVQKYLQRRHERPLVALDSTNNEQSNMASKLAPRAMSPVLVSLRPISPDALLLKLSPKVYHDKNGATCVVKTRSVPDVAQDNHDSDDCATTINDGVTECTCEQEGSQDVHPPSQEENSNSSDSEDDDGSQEDGHRWSRAGSFKKRFQIRFGQSKSHDNATFSDGELVNGKMSTSSSMMALDNASEAGSSGQCSSMVDVGRVGSWAVSFEKLLADPAGIHTFAEFLKKEFSHENIIFWVACERYRRVTDKTLIKEYAKEIFERHLGLGASEPVNVDSHARQMAQDELSHPDHNIFAQAQKQIFNLMKFDCYSRFLKSPIYCECMLKEVAGQPLPYLGNDDLDPEIPPKGANVSVPNGKKSKDKKEDGEDRRRKSLLPWHRTKSGKLKKKKEKKEDAFASSWSDMTGSRSSLASSDIPPFQRQTSTKTGSMSGSDQQDSASLCRIRLPDHSTTVLPVKSGESVAEWTRQLLTRRGLQYSSTDVYLTSSNKAVEPDTDSIVLAGREIQIEGRISLHVELPNKQVIDIAAKSDSTLSNVLKPALQKHGFKMDSIVVIGAAGQVDVDQPASTAISHVLTVVPNSKANDSNLRDFKQQNSLNELTGKVFDNLLTVRKSIQDDERVCDSVRGYFRATNCPIKPPITARPPRHRRKNSDEMYDLWKKAQCSRLDDQRGTEINFELPEFLKTHPKDGNGGGRCRILDGRASEPIPLARPSKSRSSHFSSSDFFGLKTAGSEDSLLTDGIIPTHEQAEEYFSVHPQSYACNVEKRTLQDFGLSRTSSKGVNRPPLSRPCSHPPPKAPVLWRRSASVPVCDYSEMESLVALSSVKEAPASTSFSLDLSLSPSSIPHPSILDTSIHGEVADYPPPSPLGPSVTSDKPIPPQIPLRLSAIDPPPPLPPKPRFNTRRPVPPAPPQLSEPRVVCANSEENTKNYGCKNSEVTAIDKGMKMRLKDAFLSDKFSISFV